MNSLMETPHLNPLPTSGETRKGRSRSAVNYSPHCWLLQILRLRQESRASQMLVTHQLQRRVSLVRREDRLCLSQRERIKVRDCSQRVSLALTKLLAEHCRVLRELDDSKIGVLQFLGARKTHLASDHAVDRYDSCVRRDRVQWSALQRNNRNRVCMDPTRAVAGICILRNFGSADFAKERAPSWSGGCADNERGLQEANSARVMGSREEKLSSVRRLQPLTSILSPQPGRGGFHYTSRGPFTRAPRLADSVRSAARFQASRVARDLTTTPCNRLSRSQRRESESEGLGDHQLRDWVA